MSWFSELQPASWAGLSFVCEGGVGRFGRRVAEHDYPNRDQNWVEDLGRAGRRIRRIGYIWGSDVLAQQKRFIAEAEKPGPRQLIDPTLGALTVTLARPLEIVESKEHGGVFVLAFDFVESGQRVFPDSATATQDAVQAAATKSWLATAQEYVDTLISNYRYGAAVIQQAEREVQLWANRITTAYSDGAGLFKSIVSLPADVQSTFGRYFGGRTFGGFGISAAAAPPGTTVQTLLAQGSAQRTAIATASVSAVSAASQADASTTADQIQAIIDLIIAAAPDPADALRLLGGLAVYATSSIASSAPIGAAIAAVSGASADLFRRAAVIGMGQVASQYQPSSQDDAAATRMTVVAAIDAEILVAGDAGEDSVYLALRTLRAAVSKDLLARGGGLASVTPVQSPLPIPALVWAQRLYQDASRTDELITQANPIHPAFMPVKFSALSR